MECDDWWQEKKEHEKKTKTYFETFKFVGKLVSVYRGRLAFYLQYRKPIKCFVFLTEKQTWKTSEEKNQQESKKCLKNELKKTRGEADFEFSESRRLASFINVFFLVRENKV